MPVLHANYGYCFTAHKAQGSEWPWALVVLERSVNLGTEDGLRWCYTALTRAKTMAAVFQGNP
jgi:ATP-dependent exoDNAse (exonuclease V) alpha subunit